MSNTSVLLTFKGTIINIFIIQNDVTKHMFPFILTCNFHIIKCTIEQSTMETFKFAKVAADSSFHFLQVSY